MKKKRVWKSHTTVPLIIRQNWDYLAKTLVKFGGKKMAEQKFIQPKFQKNSNKRDLFCPYFGGIFVCQHLPKFDGNMPYMRWNFFLQKFKVCIKMTHFTQISKKHLWASPFIPFHSSWTNGQITKFRLQTINGLRKIAWASVVRLKWQPIQGAIAKSAP